MCETLPCVHIKIENQNVSVRYTNRYNAVRGADVK